MAQTSHGIGGLTFDASRRHYPPEINVLMALVLIVAVFEVLGRLLMGDCVPVQHPRERRDAVQRGAAPDHHPAGLDRRHHRASA